jgi:hypothetical protein
MSPCFSDVNNVGVSLEPDNTHMGDAMGSSFVQKNGEKNAFGPQITTRDASILKTTSELPIFLRVHLTIIYTLDLYL